VGRGVLRLCLPNQTFERIEVVERYKWYRGSIVMTHGIRSITPHATACRSAVFSTVKTLFTVFGALPFRSAFRRWMSSVVITLTGFAPNRGMRYIRRRTWPPRIAQPEHPRECGDERAPER
jgi:hypothetical protein